MPPSPTLIARDQRILAGYAASATILRLARRPCLAQGRVRSWSARRIPRKLGCRHERVYEALHVAGIQVRRNGSDPIGMEELSPETADRVVSLYRAGWAAKRVAAELGLPVNEVNRLVEARTLSDGSGVKRSRSEAAALAHKQRRDRTGGTPLGGRLTGEQREDIDGREVVEVAYGWPEIGVLLREVS